MNFKDLKYILFGKIKPFQMTEEQIEINPEELAKLKNLSELIDSNPGQVSYEINDLRFLSEYVDYLKQFHQFGKGDLSKLYKHQSMHDAITREDLFQNYKVGIIADTFLYNALEGSCHLKYIGQEGQNENYDFVIIASTWRGIDGYWEGITNSNSSKFKEFKNLVHHLKSKKIPVIFFNKEDPVNFDVFKEHAKEVDHVITTEVDFIEQYHHIGISKVHHLKFPINPKIHHPIDGLYFKNNSGIIFAGSWIEKYRERNKDATILLDGVIESDYDLTIFDRNLWLNQSKYQFPAKYLNYIAAPLSHKTTMKMHKIHPIALNLNTIKYSKSMCANRVFELQAMGNFLFSNYNTFVNMTMPQVQMIFHSKDIEQTLKIDDILIERATASSIRSMMLKFNHYQWLVKVTNFLGLAEDIEYQPTITVIIEEHDQKALQQLKIQNYHHYIIKRPNQKVETEYYTYFSSQHSYESEYLENMVAATIYANADFITNSKVYHQYVNDYDSKNVTLFKNNKTTYEHGYSLGLTYLDNEIISRAFKTPKLSVVIPVHNNGRHLEHKCLRSIIRNKDFEQFEIVLVNDGSTDKETINILNFFNKMYSNIKLINLDTASGSASTPRNVGVKKAKSDLITFLDPDNEWIGEGINELYEKIATNQQIDIIIGNMLKVDNHRTKTHHYYSHFVGATNATFTKDTHTLLKNTKLKTASIQALIVRKSLILKNQIEMVPGALGQDSLFFLEIMNKAKYVEVLNTTVHIYYAAVSNSMTNSITTSFFDKYMLIEKERIKFLKKYGYLDIYMRFRFNYYMKNWYLSRMGKENRNNKEIILKFLEIWSLYDGISRPVDNSLKLEIEKLKSEV